MLTVMISTKNRSDFLIRLLKYYAEQNCKFCIDIGDSSDNFHFERTKPAVDNLTRKLKVNHYRHSGLRLPASVRELTRGLKTPYAAFIADDDFLIPNRFKEAVKFLENNPEYSAVQGKGLLFSLKSSGPYGEFAGTSPYLLRSIEADTASKRLIDHLSSYSVTLFSIYKAQTWRKMYKNVAKIEDRSFADELLPCSLSVIYGKVKKLDYLYLIRQGHDCRNFLSDTYDWITSSKWQLAYQTFHDCLVEALIEQDDIGSDAAHGVVKQAFWGYLNSAFNSKYNSRYRERSRTARVRNILKSVPAMEEVWCNIKPFVSSSKDVLLTTLLRPNSSYHADFMPVYQAVTGEKPAIKV